MKTLLSVISIAIVLFLSSCKDDNPQSGQDQPQQREVKRLPQSQPPTKDLTQTPTPAAVPKDTVHTVVVTEVIDVKTYTYLKVKGSGPEYWMAVPNMPLKVGDTIVYANPMKMENFTSQQLNRTFESILFVGAVKKLPADSTTKGPVVPEKPGDVKKPGSKVTFVPAKGGLTIGNLFDNRISYSGKVVRIRGKVTKFSKAIMGKNWVHLQDGTGGTGTNDLLVTTQEVVSTGDVVEFEGTITLNKDFGAGYKYEVLMEKGKKIAK
jgi:hypothetical protein